MTRDEAIPVLVEMERAARDDASRVGVGYRRLVQSANALVLALADMRELATVKAECATPQRTRRACGCDTPDPVMQVDEKFYCHTCGFQTGARPSPLEPEDTLKRALDAESELRREMLSRDSAQMWRVFYLDEVIPRLETRAKQAEAERDAARRTLAAVETLCATPQLSAEDIASLLRDLGPLTEQEAAIAGLGVAKGREDWRRAVVKVLAALTPPTPSEGETR